MNIDERLDAMAQSLELLVSLHKDNERRMAELIDNNNRLSIIIAHDHMLEDHEHRLGDIERKGPKRRE